MTRSALFSSVAVVCLAAPVVAQAQTPPGHDQATAAYAALAAGDLNAALPLARQAVAAQPDNLEWRLLLADVLLKSARPAEALETLQSVAGAADYRVQTRRADAAAQAGDQAQAAEAFGLAAPLAPDASSRAYLTRARAQALVAVQRPVQARTALRQAVDDGVLPGPAPLDFAYVAASARADDLAVQGFRAADAAQPLQGPAALDAAYAARRAGQDRQAAEWLRQGVRSLPSDQLTAQRRHEIGRELEALERRAGGSATVAYGPVATPVAARVAGEDATQAGAEAWFRVGGYNNGRPVDVFARAFGTVDAESGPVGGDSVQGWVGLRWKPLAETNLVLEASRMIALGDAARDDTMLRASWSGDIGGDLRFDHDAWPSSHVFIDAARILDAHQTLAVADASVGWTFVASESRRDLVTVGAGVRADYDSAQPARTAVGAGPRVSWRRWIGGDAEKAPGSYLDVAIGYDFDLGADRRIQGPSARVSLTF